MFGLTEVFMCTPEAAVSFEIRWVVLEYRGKMVKLHYFKNVLKSIWF